MTDSLATHGQKSPRVIKDWRPEEAEFWQQRGKKIARRNLWISVPCLLLGFCVWMLFSAVAVNLNKVGFAFSTEQLFMLTAIPSVSGALLRVPYSFMIPLFGGRRWTAISTLFLVIPCLWLGFAVQNSATPFSTFLIIALLCGFGGANFASSMSNISFFFPKARQGAALGINGGLGNLGVSVMQLVAPLAIAFALFDFFSSYGHLFGNGNVVSNGQLLADGKMLWLQNAAWIWLPFLLVATLAAWFGMNDIASSKASIRQQLPVLKRGDLWIMSLLYLAAFGSFIGFSAGFAVLTKIQFPAVEIMHYAFFGPFIGALARSFGGMLSDKLGGVRVTLVNYLMMAGFAALLFLTLPVNGQGGNFIAFFGLFMALFLTAGLGSGSTYQMIALIFRQTTAERALAAGKSPEQAQREAVTDTAAALGFISSIGAIGGFFIPQAFGLSLALTGSPAGAMKVFLLFYLVCAAVTFCIYGRQKGAKKANKAL